MIREVYKKGKIKTYFTENKKDKVRRISKEVLSVLGSVLFFCALGGLIYIGFLLDFAF